MKRSKHFRKDVILARVIFGVLCIVISVAIGLGVSTLSKVLKDGSAKETQPQSSEEYEIPEIIDTEEIESETEPVEVVVIYAKTKSKVNMRVEPNTNCTVLASVPAGTKTQLIEEVDGWYKVIYNDTEGYIRGDYIELVEEVVVNEEGGDTAQ